jgi:hypothetical protein
LHPRRSPCHESKAPGERLGACVWSTLLVPPHPTPSPIFPPHHHHQQARFRGGGEKKKKKRTLIRCTGGARTSHHITPTLGARVRQSAVVRHDEREAREARGGAGGNGGDRPASTGFSDGRWDSSAAVSGCTGKERERRSHSGRRAPLAPRSMAAGAVPRAAGGRRALQEVRTRAPHATPRRAFKKRTAAMDGAARETRAGGAVTNETKREKERKGARPRRRGQGGPASGLDRTRGASHPTTSTTAATTAQALIDAALVDCSSLFISMIASRTSPMLVSRTMPPMTISSRM